MLCSLEQTSLLVKHSLILKLSQILSLKLSLWTSLILSFNRTNVFQLFNCSWWPQFPFLKLFCSTNLESWILRYFVLMNCSSLFALRFANRFDAVLVLMAVLDSLPSAGQQAEGQFPYCRRISLIRRSTWTTVRTAGIFRMLFKHPIELCVLSSAHHVHHVDKSKLGDFDISHVIHHLSFGEDYPNQHHPLDGHMYSSVGVGRCMLSSVTWCAFSKG